MKRLLLLCLMAAVLVSCLGLSAQAAPTLSWTEFYTMGDAASAHTRIDPIELDGTTTLFLPASVSRKAVPVYFTLSEKNAVVTATGSRGSVALKSGDTLDLTALCEGTDDTITLRARSGSMQAEKRVTFLGYDNVSTMFLVSDDPVNEGREWVESSEDKSNRAKGSMALLAADGESVYDGKLTQIKGRGNSTWKGAKRPYQIKLDKKTAIAQLTRYYKGKAFLPKAFKSQNHIAEIQGVYVPFWLYDAKADARGRYEGQNSESHREGDYMVTTTQHYDVRREGSAAFAKVPVDGSSKMPNTHMDAIEPFDYGDLKPFSTAYLPGYLADRYDEDADACAERAYRRMYNSTADALHATTGGYSEIHPISENINVDMTHAHYALLPVWMLHTRWKDKDFLFAMNGQTGRLIGDLPVDKSRVAAWFAGISLPLMAVLAFLLLL